MSIKKLTVISICSLVLLTWGCSTRNIQGQVNTNPWYQYNDAFATRWSSPENLNGGKGVGGMENATAKGHAYDAIESVGSRTLLDVQGTGIIDRIWITVIDRSPEMLRSLKLEMFWDNEIKPAVSVPLADFFGVGLARMLPFHNAVFADPEGRSFNCFIPMPFKTGAKITITNESGKKLTHIFFDVDFQLMKTWQKDYLYFHAYWNRDTSTTPGKDFELLPALQGRGRFLGVNIGINANPAYGDAWWGEGEVKMFLDGDKDFPTLAGTGTEDYIGTGWGQGVFSNDYAGCLVADAKNLQWAYYRYHIPDPVFFETGCRITLQQIGGNTKDKIRALEQAHVPLIPVTVDHGGTAVLLFKDKKRLDDPSVPDGWTNFYRSDDVSATAYFYLSTPASNLPALQSLPIRVYRLKDQ
ncbi:MAG TPA: glycoside hydrolase family 172 protein [Puia sp.]|nr:glycoside hydrolase family 172 protein [Puia sp.]